MYNIAMQDFDSPVTYYLVSNNSKHDPISDLELITRQVSTQDDIKILQRTSNILDYSYNETHHRVLITLDTDKSLNRYFKITCESIDNISINFLKIFVDDFGYRVFNPVLGCFIPASTDLVDLTTFRVDLDTQAIFALHILKPIFMFRNSYVYYAQNGDGHVHLVNRHLLAHLRDLKPEDLPPKKLDFFSIQIATDLPQFIALFDRGVVPISYYETLHQGANIINLSSFNIHKLECNLTASLTTLVLDRVNQKFVSSKKYPDRQLVLTKGESLLSHFHKYLSLKISKDISFDPDFTPRLSITLFLDSPISN